RRALGPSPLSEAAYAPDHFARSLITKLRARLGLFAQPVTTVTEYRLDDELLFLIPASVRRPPAECATKMSYAFGDIVLPASIAFQREVACEGSLESGENGSYRALYAAATLHLNRNSTIIRWCHADVTLKISGGCRITGRASANETIEVDAPCLFVSMTAPTILAGDAQPRMRDATLPDPVSATMTEDRVVRGPVSLVAGTRLRGSVKARRRLEVGADSVIDGALVCEGEIIIGMRCVIWGPIIAEGDIHIAEGCEIGCLDRPTSVVGEDVEISVPAVIHGALHARQSGRIKENSSIIL
ncbi:MAG: bactofilin family protein, partial [Acidiferrobacter sp.]